MRIAYVSAGAGGMICGSCLHDNTLAASIRRLGHDIVLIPTYTPIRTDEADVSLDQVFYGAVNIYLQGKSAFFRGTPRVLDKLLDHPSLLKWVSGRASSTSAADLGSLALSVLRGEQGGQSKELRRLIVWLRDEFKPEVVHLTNSMFLGLAAPIRRELKVPVVCSVQGEDLFFDRLEEPYKTKVVSELRTRAGDVDTFIATSNDYAQRMTDLLGVSKSRMQVVSLGLNLAGFDVAVPDPARPFTVGYLARMSPEKGFHLLAEGFRRLAESEGRQNVRLRAAGYLGANDRSYYDEVQGRLASWGLADRFEYLGEVDRAGKIAFLGSIDLLSVPTIYREAKGLFVLEALARGIPVVEPRHGSFPELIEQTGGGLLFEPGSAAGLAVALAELMHDPARRRVMGEAGARAVRARFSDDTMAREMLKVYLAATEGECTS